MNIRSRVEKLEDAGPQQPVVLFQRYGENEEQVIARWSALHPGESPERRTVHILSWEKPQ